MIDYIFSELYEKALENNWRVPEDDIMDENIMDQWVHYWKGLSGELKIKRCGTMCERK